MPETTYRRNPDGTMETILPQAQGKAAALSAFLSKGGTPFKHSGRYKKGPMKGRNTDEATAAFERMWAASPDALKQKYADRASGKTSDLAPSERARVDSLNPAPQKDMSPAAIQKRRMASYGHEFDKNGNAVPIGRQTPATPAPAAKSPAPSSSFVPGSDEARAAANAENQSNERFATAGRGNDMANAAIVAASKASEQEANQAQVAKRASEIATTRTQPRIASQSAPALGKPVVPVQARPNPSISATNPSVERAFPGIQAQAGAAPAVSGVNPSVERAFPGIQAQAGIAAQSVGAPSAKAQSDVAYGQIADQRKAEGYPQTPPARKINPQTGLPMGYRPGDAVAPAQEAKANESVMNQRIASAPRAIPVLSPSAPDRYSAAQAAYQSGKGPATAMDGEYAKASSQDQATITANSLRRAAPLAQRDSALAAAARKPVTGVTRPQFARR